MKLEPTINHPLRSRRTSVGTLARLVREALDRGATVEIDGLGTFQRSGEGEYTFVEKGLPKVFIAYVHEDAPAAERLFDSLEKKGFDPWLDRRKLLPGQNWPRSIEDALETSDFFIGCFSRSSVNKRGGFQAEIRYALDCARRMPLDDVFLVPVRLDNCRVPVRIEREVQHVDLFPDWDAGMRRMMRVMSRKARSPRAA